MSDIKFNSNPYENSETALTEYVDAMLRTPQPATKPAMPPPVVTADEDEADTQSDTEQYMKVQVDDRNILIPIVHVSSALSLDGQSQVNQQQRSGPAMGEVYRQDRHIPLFDLGWMLEQRISARSHAVILRGQHFALACDQICDILNLEPESLQQSHDQRPAYRWIQSYLKDGMIPVANIREIKDLFRAVGN